MPKIQLSKNFIRSTCKLALNEDLYPSGDITTNLLNNNSISKVKLISNEKGIIGGLEFAKQTFNLLDRNIKFHIKKKEGSKISKGSVIAVIEGKIKNILIGDNLIDFSSLADKILILNFETKENIKFYKKILFP